MSTLVDHIEVRWRPSASQGVFQTQKIPPSQGAVTIPGVERGVQYDVEARSVSARGTASDWVPVQHTVALANMPLGAPTGLTAISLADGVHLAWVTGDTQLRADTEFEIWRAPDNAGSPGAFALLTTLRGTAYTDGVTDGVVRWYEVREKDQQGNYSAFAAAISSRGKTPPPLPTGKNMVGNSSFTQNNMGTATNTSFTNGQHIVDGWDAFAVSSNSLLLWEAGTSPYGAHPFFGLRYGSVAASGNAICWINATPNFPVSPGQQFVLSAHFNNANNTSIAGLLLYVRLGVRWFKADGTASSTGESESAFAVVWGDQYPTLSVTAPGDAATGLLYVGQTTYNNTGSAIAITGFPFDTRCYMASCVSINNLDTEVADGTAYARLAALDSTPVGGVNRLKLGVAGSGAQIGDQRNLPQLAVLNYRAKYAPALSFSSAAGSPATATMTVGAATALIGNISVSYGTMSVSVTGTGGNAVTYFLYFDDPAYAGGTPVLNATTNGNDCYAANGRVFAGSISFTFPTSGSGSGGGLGGLCVADDMWISEGLRAGDAKPGDWFDCVDLPTRLGKHRRQLIGVTRGIEECVRLITSGGARKVVSISTPFDLPDSRRLLAPKMLHELVLTDRGIEPVVEIQPVGPRPVSRNHLGGISYAGGEDPRYRIYSHNSTQKP